MTILLKQSCAVVCAIALSACARPEPAAPPAPRVIEPSTRQPARLPDAAPPAPKPTPPFPDPGTRAGVPLPPRERPVPAQFGHVPPAHAIEFHLQVEDRGDIPGTRGLAGTLSWPAQLPVFRGTTRCVYGWRPPDGKENRRDPRTGQSQGTITKPTLAEMMLPENFRRHLDAMAGWLDVYVPREFDGVVCFDAEEWLWQPDAHHTPPAAIEAEHRDHPGKSHIELFAEYVRRTEDRARALRPRVRAWGWWGAGEAHPGFIVWNPEIDYPARMREAARLLQGVQAPMPVFYSAPDVGDAALRAKSWEKRTEYAKMLWSEDRLRRDGYGYINVRHGAGTLVNRPQTREEFMECVEAGLRSGVRRFILWDAIESRDARDNIQRWIDEVFTPAVTDLEARDTGP